ncbi:M15 family metallopeptidase [Nocardioides pyridinolyticus]
MASQDEGPAAEIHRLSNRQWREMVEAGMVRPECPVQRPSELRVVQINHFDFDGAVKRGQLVVNADVAESVVRIFSELYEQRFPIRRMDPVEAFDGDTNASLAADNTSAFNCRRADQINAPFAASPHANGRAVDINPRENPWRDLRCDCWFPSPRLKARDAGDGKITKGGIVWRAFRAEGWIWQNIDVPDYMHFDTGYPSRPLRLDRGL